EPDHRHRRLRCPGDRGLAVRRRRAGVRRAGRPAAGRGSDAGPLAGDGLRGHLVRGDLTPPVAVLASGTTAGDDRPRGRPRGRGVPATARAPATTVARRRPGMTAARGYTAHGVVSPKHQLGLPEVAAKD